MSPPSRNPDWSAADERLLGEALEAAAEQAPADARVCPQCDTEYPAGVRFCARDGAALRARSVSNELEGQIVAEKYLVLRKLGVGGMGEVYLARHVHMGRECALKIMRRELTDDFDAAGRFRREAASASRVNHPNIATIYDFGETADGIAYIVMEYVDGEPLSAILGREGRLEPARAVAIARQIADALGAAHELGIVHRDLKPDNVMIARSHDAERVKVVDFGIAKAIQGGSRQLTRTGYVLGTPAYMSPEQIMGGDLDGRSDQYNLACILFEMLTGRVTFAGATGEIVIHRRLTEPPPHPRKLNPAVPRSLDAVVVHALARTPEERFANAADFGVALAEAIATSGARWSTLAWLGRGGSASGGLGDSSISAVVSGEHYGTQPSGAPLGIAVTGERTGEAPGEPDRESSGALAAPPGGSLSHARAARRPRSLALLAVAGAVVVLGAVGAAIFFTRDVPAPVGRSGVATSGVLPAPTAPGASASDDPASADSAGAAGMGGPATEGSGSAAERAERAAPARVEAAGGASSTTPTRASDSPSTAEPAITGGGGGAARQPASTKDSAPAASTTQTQTPAASAGAAAAEAAGVLRNYVSALSRRDLSTMRKLWPTMPEKTVDGFQALFQLATNFSASLTGDPAPRVVGSDADAELRYALDYFLPSQGAHQQSFRLHAVMRRVGDGWTITSLEPVH